MQMPFEIFFENKYQETKEAFYKYTKPRYLAVESLIGVGLGMYKYDFYPQIGENLFVLGTVFLGILVNFHDEFEELEEKSMSCVIEDLNDFCNEKYLLVKESFDYYKNSIF
jgi:hypothetical protein